MYLTLERGFFHIWTKMKIISIPKTAPSTSPKPKKPVKKHGGARRGIFTPQNPHKVIYADGKTELDYKSGLELAFFEWCDKNIYVLKYGYELQRYNIPYDFIDEKLYPERIVKCKRLYIPDFWIEISSKSGNIMKYLIEIKPYSQSVKPNRPMRFSSQRQEHRWISDMLTYLKNQAKWKSAKAFCASRTMGFRVLTERTLLKRPS